MEDEHFSITHLQDCSYRFLQQTAKSMGLPSNVKKVYLIQLIYTKKYGRPDEAEMLVKQVRLERQQLALVRKKAMRRKKHAQQSTVISSTSNSKSPPITNTPKRVSHILIRYSPERHSPIKYPRTLPAKSFPNPSDRVLRSFNRIKKPSYLLNNTLISLFESPESDDSVEARVNTADTEKRYPRVDRTYGKRSLDNWRRNREIVPVPRNGNTTPLARSQRKLSGIYPLHPEDIKPPNVSVRRADGSLSKLNAIIQKPFTQHNYNYKQNQTLNTEAGRLSIEPKISEVENISEATMKNMPQNTFNYTSSSDELNVSNPFKENDGGNFSVYYHKKIRAEQVRTLKSKETKCIEDCRLPKINEVFSKFNTYCRDVTQPIYVQVDTEPEIVVSVPNLPYIPDPRVQHQSSSVLEKIYNLKKVLESQPLLQISTSCVTRTVYSTPVIATAKAQPSAPMHSVCNIASLSRDSDPYFLDDSLPRVHEFFRDFRCEDEDLNDVSTIGFTRSNSSAETLSSQELGANVTIPEMVEDALEIISQDGDYMERMGMDIRMQCILCNWAGPKIILEYHIRKEHSAAISLCPSSGWHCTYSLGALWAHRLWLSQLVEHRQQLYVLSAKYEDPDLFMAALSTLSSDPDTPVTGSMTIYNKVTGEPFTWEGPINELPPNMPYDAPNCFKLGLSRMNLLPNSANLQLLNRELVIRSPTKVVVGQPELDNIHITLNVKIFD